MTAPLFRSGFISIIGEPNVGKSTLLNRLVGQKLAPVSNKPQTTRQVIRGILTEKRGQAIFVDTPGFHEPHDQLGKWMIGEIEKALEGADLVYWMVFPQLPGDLDRRLAERCKEQKGGIFLLINQVDRVEKEALLPVIDAYQKLYPFREVVPISALKGDNLEVLVGKTFEALPEHAPYFDSEQLSDQNEKEIVSEMIREKLFRFTGQEIPYSTAVEIEEFKEKSENLAVIRATIVVEKESQRGILIGKGGVKIKQIGQNARKEIERFLAKRVFLELWVKTYKNWKKDPQALRRLGYQ